MKYKSLLLIAALCVAGCESATTVQTGPITVVPANRTLFVVNEGNYLKTNSSVDAILFQNLTSKPDTIDDQSVVKGLGGGNDVLIAGSKAVVLDNGSNTIDIIDADSLKLLAQVPIGLDAPNKMATIDQNTVLVTRRKATSAAIVNLTTHSITDTIGLGGASIAVAVKGKEAFITTGTTEYEGPFQLQIVDLTTKAIKKRIALSGSPEQAYLDSNGFVIVEANGDYVSVSPQFYFISPGQDIVFDSVNVATDSSSVVPVAGAGNFAIVDGNVYNIPTSGSLGQALISGNYYNGFCDAVANEVYLGVNDFLSGAGKVDVYDAATYKLKRSFLTGIAPAHFAFYH